MERDFEWNVRRGAEDAWKMGGSDEDSTFRVENIDRAGGVDTHGGCSAGSPATSRTRARARIARTGTRPRRAPPRGSRLGTAYRTRCCVRCEVKTGCRAVKPQRVQQRTSPVARESAREARRRVSTRVFVPADSARQGFHPRLRPCLDMDSKKMYEAVFGKVRARTRRIWTFRPA